MHDKRDRLASYKGSIRALMTSASETGQRQPEAGQKETHMTTPLETVRAFYSAITAGDSDRMIQLMSPDIEWISVVDFGIQENGPAEVMKKVFAPLMEEWESFSPAPSEFVVEGATVVSLGRFACVHRATHKRADLPYAHAWNVKDGKIWRHRQYLDTVALQEARRV